VLEHNRRKKTGLYERRHDGNLQGLVVVQFVSVEINWLGNFLEQSKLYSLTSFVPLKCCCGGYSAGVGYTFRDTGRAVICD
jgi:hypothetical protein